MEQGHTLAVVDEGAGGRTGILDFDTWAQTCKVFSVPEDFGKDRRVEKMTFGD